MKLLSENTKVFLINWIAYCEFDLKIVFKFFFIHIKFYLSTKIIIDIQWVSYKKDIFLKPVLYEYRFSTS